MDKKNFFSDVIKVFLTELAKKHSPEMVEDIRRSYEAAIANVAERYYEEKFGPVEETTTKSKR
jgi:hypothetical protein